MEFDGLSRTEKDMRNYDDYLDNIYNENQFNYEQEILSDLDSRRIDGPGDDFYLDEATGEIQWIPGSEDWSDYGYIHLGGGLMDGVDVKASRIHKRGFWKSIWYSDFARNLVPDRLSLKLDYNVAVVLGFGQDLEGHLMTRGPGSGFFLTNSVAQRAGVHGDVGVEIGIYRYNGAPEEMTRKTVEGKYIELDGGAVVQGAIQIGLDSGSPYGISWYGASGGVGFTIGASGGYGVTRMGFNQYPDLY